jgi:hypothetical protein
MNGPSKLVVFHEDSLKSFSPGQVIESSVRPHKWFSLVDPPKVVAKKAPKVVAQEAPKVVAQESPTPSPKPVVRKKSPVQKKENPPKIDLPADKF